MSFFDDMQKKLSQASQSTVQKVNDLSEVTKLNSEVSGLEKQVRELYSEIGARVYQAYCNAPLPEVTEQINRVNALQQEIKQRKQRIGNINDTCICPGCGARVQKGVPFCSVCGYKMVQENQAPQNAVCPKCGAAVTPDMKFCTGCGQKLKD